MLLTPYYALVTGVRKIKRHTFQCGVCFYIGKYERASLETELMVVEAKLDRLEKMENELDRYAVQGQIGIMGSYNNSKAEVKMLNDIL